MLFKYLEARQKADAERRKAEEIEKNRLRIYNDIAFLLWYVILYDDILKYKREAMETQQMPFRIYDWGNNAMRFGPVAALTSTEDIEKFEKRARAVLKDKHFGNLKVKVYPDAVLVGVL